MQDLLEELELQLEQPPKEVNPIISVVAPTASGKTVGIISEMIKLSLKDPKMKCYCLMPFKAGVRGLHSYLNTLHPQAKVGISVGGYRQMSAQDNVTLFTSGSWLHYGMTQIIPKLPLDTPITFLVDEAHELSWQTDLALRAILWMQKSRPIRLVLASATPAQLIFFSLDSGNRSPLLLQLEDFGTPSQVENEIFFNTIYEDEFCDMRMPSSLDSREIIDNVARRLIGVLTMHPSGDVLVIMPGLEEIVNLVSKIEKKKELIDVDIYMVHSKLSKQEMHDALHKRPQNIRRRVLLSTNILENAVSIPNLEFVIDSCVRKIVTIDSQGIKSIETVLASKSNLIQSAGRVGRFGKPGQVHYLINQSEYASLSTSSTPEALRNPCYKQLLYLIGAKLPIDIIRSPELLSNNNFGRAFAYDWPRFDRIANDLMQLLNYGMISNSDESHSDDDAANPDEDYESDLEIHGEFSLSSSSESSESEEVEQAPIVWQLTNAGEIMQHSELSLKATRFISKVCKKSDNDNYPALRSHLYLACAVAAWLDLSNSLFFSVIKRPKMSKEEFQELETKAAEKRERFVREDCLSTALTVLLTKLAEPEIKIYRWCKMNGIFDKALIEWNRLIEGICRTLYKQGIPVAYPDADEIEYLLNCFDFQLSARSIKTEIVELLERIYTDQVAYLSAHRDRQGRPRYILSHKSRNCFLDRSVPVEIAPQLQKFVACSLKKIGKLYALSKTVSLSKPYTPSIEDDDMYGEFEFYQASKT